ncbi:MAG: VCBS repeat-containing protein [Phycisphaerales bacterium]|nr:VCBS repeat-containing protein [Phycisphaerales bacterium]
MRRAACALAVVAGIATTASATWSIVIIDTRTGEIAVGSATCLTGFDLRANTPVLIPGVGAATAQSSVDQNGFNRVFMRDRLLEGVDPQEILALLEAFDVSHQSRQYGIADAMGGVATFTGTRDGQWAGGATGRVGDVVYAVQGNVLTGNPVVAETEQVIVSSLASGLDLAETMMLAMEEARSFGGDGRCSCNNNNPDSCGSPPEGWDPETGKSAHISYMLIARAGDGFGCNSVYRVGRSTYGLATGDFNEDGRLDLAAASRNDSLIGVMLGTQLMDHYVTFAPSLPATAAGLVSGLATADFDRDGHLDLLYGDPTNGRAGLLYGLGDGSFSFPSLIVVEPGATWVSTGDFNGDSWPDAAISNATAGTVTILLNNGAGAIAPAQSIAVGANPGPVISARIDADGAPDLACTLQDDNLLAILANNGAGGFTLDRTLGTDARPVGVAAGDFDGDGRTDLATANRDGRSISVFRQTAQGVFGSALLGTGLQYTAIESADIDGDGLDDLALSNDINAGLTLMLGRPGADPLLDRIYALAGGANDLAIGDFTGDGRPDLASNMRQINGIMGVAGIDPGDGEGYFNNGVGCATARYYMEFNVANQSKDDPDPVAQLHDLYDAWRVSLIGVADAVRSTADLGTDRLPVGAETTLRIEPLDWRSEPVGPGLAVGARHAAGSAGLTTLGDATDHGDGTYTIVVSAAALGDDARGTDRLEVTIAQAGETVALMPVRTLTITGPVADWNDDGVVDSRDLTAFLSDWSAHDPGADITGDGAVDSRDVVEFLRNWAGQ